MEEIYRSDLIQTKKLGKSAEKWLPVQQAYDWLPAEDILWCEEHLNKTWNNLPKDRIAEYKKKILFSKEKQEAYLRFSFDMMFGIAGMLGENKQTRILGDNILKHPSRVAEFVSSFGKTSFLTPSIAIKHDIQEWLLSHYGLNNELNHSEDELKKKRAAITFGLGLIQLEYLKEMNRDDINNRKILHSELRINEALTRKGKESYLTSLHDLFYPATFEGDIFRNRLKDVKNISQQENFLEDYVLKYFPLLAPKKPVRPTKPEFIPKTTWEKIIEDDITSLFKNPENDKEKYWQEAREYHQEKDRYDYRIKQLKKLSKELGVYVLCHPGKKTSKRARVEEKHQQKIQEELEKDNRRAIISKAADIHDNINDMGSLEDEETRKKYPVDYRNFHYFKAIFFSAEIEKKYKITRNPKKRDKLEEQIIEEGKALCSSVVQKAEEDKEYMKTAYVKQGKLEDFWVRLINNVFDAYKRTSASRMITREGKTPFDGRILRYGEMLHLSIKKFEERKDYGETTNLTREQREYIDTLLVIDTAQDYLDAYTTLSEHGVAVRGCSLTHIIKILEEEKKAA